MKTFKITIFLLLIVALLWPVTAYAGVQFDDRVVFGGTFTLKSGETQQGSVVVFGGAVTTEADSTVNGDVVLIGGTIELGGEVNGNVVGIGGAVRLTESARVNGDLVTVGATLRREDGAVINGQIVNGLSIPFSSAVPDFSDEGPSPETEIPKIQPIPQVTVDTNPLIKIIWFFFRTFLYAALAVLLVIFLQAYVTRVAKAAITQPVITAGAGLLTAVLAPLALVVITITIILIPVTLVTVILLVAAWLFGWVALGYEIGRRIAKAINMELAPAIAAGVGTFVLVFVLGGINQLIPCVGWVPQTLFGLWGLGAVLMTRFGTQDYPVEDQAVIESEPKQLTADVPEGPEVSDVEPSSVEDVIPDDGLGSGSESPEEPE